MWIAGVAACGGTSAAGSTGGGSTTGVDASTGPISAGAASDEGIDATGASTTGGPTRPDGWAWDFEGAVIGAPVPTAAGAIVDTDSGLAASADDGLRYVAGRRPGAVAIAFAGDGAGLGVAGESVTAASDVDADESLGFALTFRTDVHGRGGPELAGTLIARDDAWWLGIVDGALALELADGSHVASTIRVDDGLWHTATVGLDRPSATLLLAIDGGDEVAIPVAIADALVGADTLWFGRDDEGARGLLGEIDEVAFARTAPPRWTPGPRRAASTVFRAGEIPRLAGGSYAAARIPAIVTTPGGTLLAFAEGRVFDTCDIGDIDVILARSHDGGATWSTSETVVDAGSDRVFNPISIVDAVRGQIVLMTSRQPVAAGCTHVGGACTCEPGGSATVEVRIADGEGNGWGDPIDVTAGVTDPSGASLLLGPSHGIQLADGALVVPAMHRRSSDGKRGGHVVRSDDGGASWSVALSETASPVNVNESSIAELDDGSLLFGTRHQLSAEDVTAAEIAAGLRGQASIRDGAWVDDPPFARVPALRGPVVHGTLLGWPGSTRHGDEPRVLFTLPAGEHGTNAGRRHDLRVWISHDRGASWADGIRLDGMWSAYSDLVAIDDGHIGVLYETGAAPGDFYQRIDFLRARVQPLEDATLASWTFETVPRAAFDEVDDGGPLGLGLARTGAVEAVDGRRGATAVRFAGDGRLCRSEADLHSALDLGPRDALAIEVVFRTSAHGAGDASGAGVLVGKTDVGTEPAWWLRVEDGHLRFLAATCPASADNCGVLPGECAGLSGCDQLGVISTVAVDDGAWHQVVVTRDPADESVRLVVDGITEAEATWPAGPIVKNDEPVCIGAFADGSRAFVGDIDLVRIRSRPIP